MAPLDLVLAHAVVQGVGTMVIIPSEVVDVVDADIIVLVNTILLASVVDVAPGLVIIILQASGFLLGSVAGTGLIHRARDRAGYRAARDRGRARTRARTGDSARDRGRSPVPQRHRQCLAQHAVALSLDLIPVSALQGRVGLGCTACIVHLLVLGHRPGARRCQVRHLRGWYTGCEAALWRYAVVLVRATAARNTAWWREPSWFECG
eukprot:scaffold103053_cov96-Phaeocystis_antarctica.AAC.4